MHEIDCKELESQVSELLTQQSGVEKSHQTLMQERQRILDHNRQLQFKIDQIERDRGRQHEQDRKLIASREAQLRDLLSQVKDESNRIARLQESTETTGQTQPTAAGVASLQIAKNSEDDFGEFF